MSTDMPQNNFKVIPDFLKNSVKEHPNGHAFSEWDEHSKSWIDYTWETFNQIVDTWRKAFWHTGLKKGDRVAILLPNSVNAALCDMAVLGNALTPVPLHAVDTPKSSAFIINDSESKLLFVPKALRWNAIASHESNFPHLREVIVIDNDLSNTENSPVPVITLEDWLKRAENGEMPTDYPEESDLAAIVYTSGTTGKPKGVMLSHKNVVSNVKDCDAFMKIQRDDVFLSFLPFSHTFERTVGYYLPTMKNAHIVFSRGVLNLAEDLKTIRPTVFISVPRIFERFQSRLEEYFIKAEIKTLADYAVDIGWRRFCHQNGLEIPESNFSDTDSIAWAALKNQVVKPLHDLFGGRLRLSIVGGAALSNKLGRFYCALELPLYQGYGLTESSPVISLNKEGYNNPITVGQPLPSMQVRIGEKDELQVRGPTVMQGYWNRPDATKEAFTEDGWLRTGDQADLFDTGHILIKGRIKEIIVTSTGEKIAPQDLELAIQADSLFDQAMVVGENRPFITCLTVINEDEWKRLANEFGVDPDNDEILLRRDIRMAALKRIKKACSKFPQYGVPRNVILLRDPWTVDNGCLTVTMKLRRKIVAEKLKTLIESLYSTPQAN